ncbi:cyclic nucleotide-binding domain-containing protein [Actinoplanes sp. NPDC049599]|uniref:cyclic nucleotide-binding domain-containing protein n=1 Tax=Actinoplanes sp. NPDC049599 TaxID=3363903 RepID=UPI0037A156FA
MSADVLALVAGLPVVAGLTREQLRSLCAAGRPAGYPTGARIFAEDTTADRFWLLTKGSAALDLRVPGRGPQVIETLVAGSVLGWSWLHPPYRWQFGAVAREELDTVVFDAGAVRDRCDADPAFGYAVLRLFIPVLTTRLHATRLRLLDLYATAAQAGQP